MRIDDVRYPLKLKGALRETIWGGTRLMTEYGKVTALPNVAESWELSCHPAGLSVITEGPDAGMTLLDWIDRHGPGVVGARAAKFDRFPLLIKLIDAKRDLSVQVHPNNTYARCIDHEPGKTELWYIVDCEPGASLLYGFQRKVTREEVERRVADGTLLDICERVPVHRGDVFFIPAGTLHAIGGGILLCEIQQSSNATYRLYDYGRLDRNGQPRELHVKKALDVLRYGPADRSHAPQAQIGSYDGAEIGLLRSCPFFTAYIVRLRSQATFYAGIGSFHSFTVLRGSLHLTAGDTNLMFRQGETAFIPAGLGAYTVDGAAEFVLSEV